IERCRILAHKVLGPWCAGQIDRKSTLAKSHPPLAILTVDVPAAVSRKSAFISAHGDWILSVSALRCPLTRGGSYVPPRRPSPVRTGSHGLLASTLTESPLPVTTTIFPPGSTSYRATSMPAFCACRAILNSVGLRGLYCLFAAIW